MISVKHPRLSRRNFLAAAGTTAAMFASPPLHARTELRSTYENNVAGIRIEPGHWRPHYPWEHIAWISPPWPSQDYVWFDFPEAIFTSQGLIFLSHVNPPIDTVYESLPAVPWERTDAGLTFKRTLPSGISFEGSLSRQGRRSVDLAIHLHNGSAEPLRDLRMQTCVFLRANQEFGDETLENKFVHTSGKGWVSLAAVQDLPWGEAPYRVGWQSGGNPIADWPVVITRSNRAERYMACTWYDHTLSIVSNVAHPCVHADPRFPDLEPGEGASVRGALHLLEAPRDEVDWKALLVQRP